MKAESLSRAFDKLSTLIADAAMRLKIPFRMSPPGLEPVTPNQRLAGPVLPVRHFASVDVFLEAMQSARRDDVLVIDNGGLLDEGCIGDLTALEAEHCGLPGNRMRRAPRQSTFASGRTCIHILRRWVTGWPGLLETRHHD